MDRAALVLIVEDDSVIADVVARTLHHAGHETLLATTGQAALAVLGERRPDLVLLDIGLPGDDGFTVQALIAARWPELPVVFLTARDSVDDKVRGLLSGADDYIPKPFDAEELSARVQVVLRRQHRVQSPARRMVVGDLELDEATHQVTQAGRPIHLTPTEYKLLRHFMANPRRVISKAELADEVWQYDFGGQYHIVENSVSYLRKRIDHATTPLIHTVRGTGYCLREPDAQELG